MADPPGELPRHPGRRDRDRPGDRAGISGVAAAHGRRMAAVGLSGAGAWRGAVPVRRPDAVRCRRDLEPSVVARRDRVRPRDLKRPVEPQSDAHLRVLVESLKPRIDECFRVTTHWPGTALEPRRHNPSRDAFVVYLRTHAPGGGRPAHRLRSQHRDARLTPRAPGLRGSMCRCGSCCRRGNPTIHLVRAACRRRTSRPRSRSGFRGTGRTPWRARKPYIAVPMDRVWIVHGARPPGAVGSVAAMDGRLIHWRDVVRRAAIVRPFREPR